ncbi:MAG: V-type ATPase subunit [Firmicutes bacterium]|nr:V-type ATPase subunit [Bacillota bacterium]
MSPDNYIYISSYLRAIQKDALTRSELERLAEAKSRSELDRALAEKGFDMSGGTERAVSEALETAYKTVFELAPEPELYALLRYRYDCHNIKTAIKSYYKKEPVREELMSALGSVPSETAAKMPDEGVFGALPPHMAAAAEEAFTGYARVPDPQNIDITLDRACFMDMSECAQKGGNAYLMDYVRTLADTVNITVCQRMIRMGRDASGFFEVWVPGGGLDERFFKEIFLADDREEALWRGLKKTAYRSVGEKFEGTLPAPSKVDEACGEYLASLASGAKSVLFGAEIPAYYLIKKESDTQNVRIIASGIDAGLEPERIKALLRPVCA